MFCRLIIARYPKYFGLFGFLSMALFRLPLYASRKIKFFKLMGSGKNGTFDRSPDFNQWAVLFTVENAADTMPRSIYKYLYFFKCDIREFLLEPAEGHGLWDGKKVFGELYKKEKNEGTVAVLTRATIHLNRLKNFWSNVDGVAAQMAQAKGLIASYGIGEIPWIKQATFSIWESETSMKEFAYRMQQHKDVIKKTRSESWYKEEMFIRFYVLSVKGFPEAVAAKMLTLRATHEEA